MGLGKQSVKQALPDQTHIQTEKAGSRSLREANCANCDTAGRRCELYARIRQSKVKGLLTRANDFTAILPGRASNQKRSIWPMAEGGPEHAHDMETSYVASPRALSQKQTTSSSGDVPGRLVLGDNFWSAVVPAKMPGHQHLATGQHGALRANFLQLQSRVN